MKINDGEEEKEYNKQCNKYCKKERGGKMATQFSTFETNQQLNMLAECNPATKYLDLRCMNQTFRQNV